MFNLQDEFPGKGGGGGVLVSFKPKMLINCEVLEKVHTYPMEGHW